MLDVERITDRNHQQARFARDVQSDMERRIIAEDCERMEERKREIMRRVRAVLLAVSMILLGAGFATAGIAMYQLEWDLFTSAAVEIGLAAVAYFFGTEV